MSVGRSAWRDVGIAAALSVLAALVAGVFDVHEELYDWTRRWERWPLDLDGMLRKDSASDRSI